MSIEFQHIGLIMNGNVLIMFLIVFPCVYGNVLYKRLKMDANDWSKFVHKTLIIGVKTVIECGGHCNYYDEKCDLFIFQIGCENSEPTCHIGKLENTEQNYPQGQSGQNSLHFNLSKTHSTYPGPQSFTSLKADPRQDINNDFALGKSDNGIFS